MLPSACRALSSTNINYVLASMSMTQCSASLGRPLPTNVATCFPVRYAPTNTASTIYNCLQTADLTCRYASDCSTSTYTVGQEPPAPTPTVDATNLLQNPGFESGSKAGWTFSQPLTAFTVEDVSPARVHSGSYAYRAVFENENGHSTQMYQSLAVVPGGNYRLSAWVNHQNPAESYCGVSVFGNPAVTYAYTSVSLRDVPANQWQLVTVNFQAAASWLTASLSFYCNVGTTRYADNGKNTLYFDDVSLVRTDLQLV
ncbi:hypothetical protein GE09DRAFT_1069216 [Coniochaeta sp. 2T2.1]|nr:hypothetical protein GE09DRAFT_1069216 [Coniochaeta sp. 2T2.1]